MRLKLDKVIAKRAKKTDFRGRGIPSTQPGTADDALRIQLSRRITAILVEHGDEALGSYHIPGTPKA